MLKQNATACAAVKQFVDKFDKLTSDQTQLEVKFINFFFPVFFFNFIFFLNIFICDFNLKVTCAFLAFKKQRRNSQKLLKSEKRRGILNIFGSDLVSRILL